MKKIISALNKNYNEIITWSFFKKCTLLLLIGIFISLFKIAVYGIYVKDGYIDASLIDSPLDVNVVNQLDVNVTNNELDVDVTNSELDVNVTN